VAFVLGVIVSPPSWSGHPAASMNVALTLL
jgi:hypothetical protein